jgi:hypothetical protein
MQPDQREAKFSVTVIDDDRFEKSEQFRVTLSEPRLALRLGFRVGVRVLGIRVRLRLRVQGEG